MMETKELWIVGHFIAKGPDNSIAWSFYGVYDDKQVAISRCINETYFVAPAMLNEDSTYEEEPWQGAEYPIIKLNENE